MKIKNLVDILVGILLIVLSIWFFWEARNWELLLLEDWSAMPELANLSAILEYFKAFIKIFIVSIFAIVYTLWRKGNHK